METINIADAQRWVKEAWEQGSKKIDEKNAMLYLIQELGETAECISMLNGNKIGISSKEKLEEEFGDVLLSLITWANLHNVSLEEGFKKSMESNIRRNRV